MKILDGLLCHVQRLKSLIWVSIPVGGLTGMVSIQPDVPTFRRREEEEKEADNQWRRRQKRKRGELVEQGVEEETVVMRQGGGVCGDMVRKRKRWQLEEGDE